MRWISDPVDPALVSGALEVIVDPSAGRVLSDHDYWQRLRPRLGRFGISRVADITGLDKIGYPVAQAVRPTARSNAVTQGKGRSLEAAAIGAVLECLEMAAGEDLQRFATVPCADATVWAQFAPGLPEGTIWPDAQTDFIACWDMLNDRHAALPKDLISTDFDRDAAAANAPILRHSIGLGAGPTPEAAVIHGLLECIEGDARLRDEATGSARRIELSADNFAYGRVLARLIAAGLRVAVHDLGGTGGMASVKASIMEQPGPDSLALPASGFATRPGQSDAIAAALAEAAQARLAVISGAREDITQRFYQHGVPQSQLEAEWTRHGPAPALARDRPDATVTLGQLVAQVGPVFAVPLHWDPELPLAIVRIIAPRLIADPMRLAPS